jgi:hypothetical protein
MIIKSVNKINAVLQLSQATKLVPTYFNVTHLWVERHNSTYAPTIFTNYIEAKMFECHQKKH